MPSRAELEQALKDGYTVLVSGHAETIRRAKLLPQEQPGRPIRGVVVRDPDGRLTREGMEHTVAAGGSVLMEGEVHTSLDSLPTGADLARGNEQRESQERERITLQMQALQSELAKLGEHKHPKEVLPVRPGQAEHDATLDREKETPPPAATPRKESEEFPALKPSSPPPDASREYEPGDSGFGTSGKGKKGK